MQHVIIDTSTLIKYIDDQESRHDEVISFFNSLEEYTGIWVSRYVVSEVISRILTKSSILNKKQTIESVWKQLTEDNIQNESKITDHTTLTKIYNEAYRLTRKHCENHNAPNFVDCYQVALANHLRKKFRTEIKLAYFDQYFPHGSYTPIF